MHTIHSISSRKGCSDFSPLIREVVHLSIFSAMIMIGSSLGFSQSTDWEANHFTTTHGLPSRMANALLEDQQGFIWVGTDKGIVRYDGYSWFNPIDQWEPENHLRDQCIYAIENWKQWIVVGSSFGLHIIDPVRHLLVERIIPNRDGKQPVQSIYIEQNGTIWCMYGSSLKLMRIQFSPDALELKIDTTFPMDSFAIFSFNGFPAIESDLEGHVWFSTKQGDLFKYRSNHLMEEIPSSFFGEPEEDFQITCFLRDASGRFWMGGRHGLFLKEGAGLERITGDPNPADEVDFVEVMHLYEDRQGLIWISRRDQLVTYDPNTKEFERKWYFVNNLNKFDDIHPSMAYNLAEQVNYCLPFGETPQERIWAFSVLDAKLHGQRSALGELKDYGYLAKQAYTSEGQALIKNGLVDRSGLIWVSSNHGIFTYQSRIPFHHIYLNKTEDQTSQGLSEVTDFLEDQYGNIWISSLNDKLNIIRDHQIATINMPEKKAINKINAVVCDDHHQLWIGTDMGLFAMDLSQGDFLKNQALNKPIVASSTEYSKYEGKYAVDGDLTTRWASLYYSPQNFTVDLERPISLSNMMIDWSGRPQHYNIQTSLNGTDWLTIDEPAKVYETSVIVIDQVARYVRINMLSRATIFNVGIREICLQSNHEPIEYLVAHNGMIHSPYVNDISVSDEAIWVATEQGLMIVEPNGKEILFHQILVTPEYDPTNDFKQVAIDPAGNCWLRQASSNQIWRWERSNRSFIPSTLPLPNHTISDLQVIDSNLYVLSTAGVFILHADRDWERISPNIDVLSMLHDMKGEIWLGTNGKGLFRGKPSDGGKYIFESYVNGNIPYRINNIYQDKYGALWLSSNHTICRIDVASQRFYELDMGDHLRPIAFEDSKGRLYFARAAGGFVQVNPAEYSPNGVEPVIAISKIQVDDRTILEQDLAQLNHNENNIKIDFTALHFDQSFKNTYAYRLSPNQKNWVDLDKSHQIVLSGLPPGKHLLEIKATNAHGVQMSQAFVAPIEINFPWYQQWWAYLLYFLVGLSTIIGYLRFQRRTLMTKQRLELEKNRAVRLLELDRTKNRLFTNVSHEFRTPLTVIMGVAKQIEGNSHKKEQILRNSDTLLRIVNQMLNLAKLESGVLKSHPQFSNIVPQVQGVIKSLQPLASRKEINIKFKTNQKKIFFRYDCDMMGTVFYNLVSNALKFSTRESEVTIDCRVDDHSQYFFLTVADQGPGVPSHLQNKIFERFYQVDDPSFPSATGTGIGLAVVKEFMKLMGGSVSVENVVPHGAQFRIALPLKGTQEMGYSPQVQQLNNESVPLQTFSSINEENGRELILLVEDCDDIASYLHGLLVPQFEFHHAKDGQQGLQMAKNLVPDLILTDLMMPVMDGLQLTKRLRQDDLTSHIPVVILTAKVTLEDRRKGMSAGAIAYLTKPFDEANLMLTIRNLLRLRHQIVQRLRSPHLSDSLTANEKREFTFLKNLHAAIDQHLDQTDFDARKLSQIMLLSQSQLYRKLKAITDQSIADYIRSYRLKKATDYLLQSDLTLREITFKTGFKSQSYFSRIFKQKFGNTPSVYRREHLHKTPF